MDADQRWGLLRLNVEDEIPLTEIARTSGIGLRTLQRWKANFHAHGYAGLARDPRSDQGTRRLDHVLVKQIEDLGLAKPRASVATIHRVITKIAREQGTVPPSYSTVRNIVTALDPGLRTLALEGPTAYRDSTSWLCADAPPRRTRCGNPTTPCSTFSFAAPTANPCGLG